MTKKQEINDWTTLRDLLSRACEAERGLQARIAVETGVDVRRLNEALKKGSEPRFTVGLALARWAARHGLGVVRLAG